MTDIYLKCSCVKHVIQAVSKSVNGGEIDAITIGNQTVFLRDGRSSAEQAALRRHENMHKVQSARYAPKWARWLPHGWRANLGAPVFLRRYLQAHLDYGYRDNPYEIEARKAE